MVAHQIRKQKGCNTKKIRTGVEFSRRYEDKDVQGLEGDRPLRAHVLRKLVDFIMIDRTCKVCAEYAIRTLDYGRMPDESVEGVGAEEQVSLSKSLHPVDGILVVVRLLRLCLRLLAFSFLLLNRLCKVFAYDVCNIVWDESNLLFCHWKKMLTGYMCGTNIVCDESILQIGNEYFR